MANVPVNDLAPINTNPVGFLSLLGIQNLGQTPRTLAQQLVGTMDMFEFYRAYNEIFVTGSQTVAGAQPQGQVIELTNGPLSDGTRIQIPSDEIWMLSHWETIWSFPIAAGFNGTFAPAYQLPSVTTGAYEVAVPNSEPLQGSATSDAAFARVGRYSLSAPQLPAVLPGGARLCAVVVSQVIDPGAGDITLSYRLRLLRLRR